MLGKRLYIVFVLFSLRMVSQVNLVPNYSFEDTVACPTSAGQLFNAFGWINPSFSIGSSPDYYNSCNTGLVNVPVNVFGFQNAKTGNAYAGFYAFNSADLNSYEYVEAMLTDTLKKDSTYCVSFYLSLSNISGYSMNNIGAYFSNNITTTASNIIIAAPQLLNTSIILSDKDEWMKIEWQYIASGGEKYITIGNFNTSLTSDTNNVGGSFPEASYYYIDDVYVGDCPNNNSTINITIPNVFTPNNDNVNDVFKITSTNLSSVNCRIYNRWGTIVGELKNTNDVWDGRTTAGLECSDGVYYYIFTAKGIDQKEYSQKGFVQLIR